jgi:hypothetical protein
MSKDNKWFKQVQTTYEEHKTAIYGRLSGSAVTATKSVRVSGFTIDVADEEATKLQREKIVFEAENEKLLRSKLLDAGIKPLAILPEDIFNKIIDKAKFYTFYRMQSDRKVYANGKGLIDNNIIINLSGDSMVPTHIVFAFLYFLYWGFGGQLLGLESTLIFSIIIAGITSALLFVHGFREKKNEKLENTFICGLLSFISPLTAILIIIILRIEQYFKKKKDYKPLLWPNRNDLDENCKDLISISLPEAPADVKMVLAKCYYASIETFLSVHPKAFQVNMDKETYKKLWIKYDPIICTRKNGMVAVLAQFGDFPEEKEVVDYIKQHFEDARNQLVEVNLN